jgi:hypothetical protein
MGKNLLLQKRILPSNSTFGLVDWENNITLRHAGGQLTRKLPLLLSVDHNTGSFPTPALTRLQWDSLA